MVQLAEQLDTTTALQIHQSSIFILIIMYCQLQYQNKKLSKLNKTLLSFDNLIYLRNPTSQSLFQLQEELVLIYLIR